MKPNESPVIGVTYYRVNVKPAFFDEAGQLRFHVTSYRVTGVYANGYSAETIAHEWVTADDPRVREQFPSRVIDEMIAVNEATA